MGVRPEDEGDFDHHGDGAMRQRLALVAATFDQIIGEVEVADLDRIRIAIDVLEAERRFCKRSSLCRVAPVVFKIGARSQNLSNHLD